MQIFFYSHLDDCKQILTATFSFEKIKDLHYSFCQFFGKMNFSVIRGGIVSVLCDQWNEIIILLVGRVARYCADVMDFLYSLLDANGVVFDKMIEIGDAEHVDITICPNKLYF